MISVDDDSRRRADARISQPRWEPRVLVVDDDEVSRLAASGLLQGLGFTVNLARDGREALEMSERWPYVAIFMDCEMPEVDGYTAARQLRARAGRNAATPVIAMTSKSRSVSLASGMDHHVTKPLETAVLEAGCRELGLLRPGGIRPSNPDGLVRVDAPLLDRTIFTATPVADRSRQARDATSFVKHTTACLPHIWRAINFGDAPALQALARTLKANAIAVGTERVAELFDRLCQAEASQATTLAADVEPLLRTVLVDTAAAIKAYTGGIPFTDGPAVQISAASGGPADQLTELIKRVASATAAGHAAAADTASHRRGIDGAMSFADGPSQEGPLDDEGIQRLQSEFGSTGILADLVDLFVSQTPERLSELRRANQAGDATAVSAGAHQLKGRCLTLAAVHMAELCDKLETTVRTGSLAQAATMIDQIERDFEKTQAALTAISRRTSL